MAEFLEAGSESSNRQIESCFALRLRFGDPVLQTEADQFLNRLRSSGVDMPDPYEPTSRAPTENMLSTAPTPSDTSSQIPIGVTLQWLVLPKAVQSSKVFTLSVVLFNGSDQVLSSTDTHPFRLSYWWERNGDKQEGLRTPLLIDLVVGRQISMPIAIKTPEEPGNYLLRVMPIIEGITWIQTAEICTSLAVSAHENDPLAVDWEQDPQARGYLEDHSRAVELCRDWINRHVSNLDPEVLELGGNFHPMAQYLPGQHYNVDIDAFGLMAYNIKERKHGAPKVKNVVANGMQLPFPADFLDVVMMFATFHHFPDPVGLLRHLKVKIKPNGILLLMCEPIGHVFRDSDAGDFISELERGVYEQSFMPWEYRQMLDQAGFEIIEAALDAGSLKLAARNIK